MDDEDARFDEELARLAGSLRGGEHMIACLQLAEFALKLDHYIRCEERTLAFAYQRVGRAGSRALSTVYREHSSLRQLVAAIASALDRADDRDGIEMIGTLRSVLLLHLEKEQLLLAAPGSRRVH